MSIDEYIAGFDEEKQKELNQVRDLIRDLLPDCIEKISWAMPTYYQKRNIIHFAGNKNHIGIYPGSQPVEHFKERLDQEKIHYSKGAIQFPYHKVDLELIKEITLYAYKVNGVHDGH